MRERWGGGCRRPEERRGDQSPGSVSYTYCIEVVCSVSVFMSYFVNMSKAEVLKFILLLLPHTSLSILYCTVLYCTVMYCTVMYCTAQCILYCTVLYCTVHTVLYCTVHTVLYYTVLYCSVLLCTVLYCTVL